MAKIKNIKLINIIEGELKNGDFMAEELIKKVVFISGYTNLKKIREILRKLDGLKWFSVFSDKKGKIYSIKNNVLSIELIKQDKKIHNTLLECFEGLFKEKNLLTSTVIKREFYKKIKKIYKSYNIDKDSFNLITQYFIDNYTISSSINIRRLIFLKK